MFLSKSDPEFLKKYLQFYPNDSKILYQYSIELEKKGELDKSFSYLRKASENGSHLAKRKLRELEYQNKKLTYFYEKQKNLKARNQKILSFILLFLLILLLLLGIKFLFNHYFFHQNEYHYYQTKEVVHETPSDANPNLTYKTLSLNKKTSQDELSVLVVLNAIENYKKENGYYPTDISKIYSNYPENWISFVPKGTSYHLDHNRLILKSGGILASSGNLAINQLHLVLYPNVNKLALIRGSETLVVYPVASGKKALPFTSSVVSERVDKPNNGNSPFGTKGMALQDNFAIHGTNAPDSIGKNITHGCVRLSNENIDNLFPYVPKGTPFSVSNSTPDKPTFPFGLPSPTKKSLPSTNETNPSVTYNWNF